MDSTTAVRLGSAFMLLAVAVGAFGAHALSGVLSPEMKAVFETGVKYHAYHALGLFAAAYAIRHHDARLAGIGALLFLLGIVLFSGSLYALAGTGIRRLGMITPLGGLAFMAGWVLIFISTFKN